MNMTETNKAIQFYREMTADWSEQSLREFLTDWQSAPASAVGQMIASLGRASSATSSWWAIEATITALRPSQETNRQRYEAQECKCDARALLWSGHEPGCNYKKGLA